jgi:hypothetical protein
MQISAVSPVVTLFFEYEKGCLCGEMGEVNQMAFYSKT